MEYLQQERPHFQFRTWYLYCRELWMMLKANVPIWTLIIYNDIWRNLNILSVLPICGTVERICYLACRIRVNKLSWVPVPYPPPPPHPLPGCHTPCPAPVQEYIPVLLTPLITICTEILKETQMPLILYIVFIKCWRKSKLKKYMFFGNHRKFSGHSQIVRAHLILLTRRHSCQFFYISV